MKEYIIISSNGVRGYIYMYNGKVIGLKEYVAKHDFDFNGEHFERGVAYYVPWDDYPYEVYGFKEGSSGHPTGGVVYMADFNETTLSPFFTTREDFRDITINMILK